MYGIKNEWMLPVISHWQTDRFADYSGSDRKCGLISPGGKRYLVKFAETHTRKNDLDTSYVNNVLAEYLSSHILDILGYPVHQTFMALYKDELVVCCENFIQSGEQLIEFGRFLRKHYDSGELGRVPDLDQMRHVFHTDEILSEHGQEFFQSYCTRFIGDALVGNFDRHMGNFGYLVTQRDVRPAPIYDNGSTLFPALSEHGMEDVLSDPKEIRKRVLLFPKAALTVCRQKVSYYDLLASGYIPKMSAAVCREVPIIKAKLPEVLEFIRSQACLTDIRKKFYSTMLQARYDLLLAPAYTRCIQKDFDSQALDRLQGGIPYTEEMFEEEYAGNF